MAKVASQSWVQAAKLCSGKGEEPLHSHFAMASNLDRFKSALGESNRRRTIANMVVANTVVRTGAKAGDAIEEERRRGHRVRVIAGMRDPIARSISLFMFHADFYGHVSRPLGPNAPRSADYMVSALRDDWMSVLDGVEPDSTFEWLNWYTIGLYRNWFDEELLPAFGIDIGASRFDREGGAQLSSGPFADALVYRVEDMSPSAPAYHRLLQHAGDFLGSSLRAFPSVNTSQTRRSHALSEEVRARFRLPTTLLDTIYDDPVVRHFYSDGEIEAFKRRWRSEAT